jgi:hypothetical protein
MTETAEETPLFFGERHAQIQRVLARSALAFSATLALSLTIGKYVGDPWNTMTTMATAGLITVLVGYYLVRWQLNGLRWLMYAYAITVISVVLVFAVRLFLYGSTSGLSIVAPNVAVFAIVLAGSSSFLRRSKTKSTSARKRI